MNKEGKYVIFNDGRAKVFGLDIMHLSIAHPDDVSSAGFYGHENSGTLTCFGESGTLQKASHPDDADIIAPLIERLTNPSRS